MNEHSETDHPEDPPQDPFFQVQPQKYTVDIPASQSYPVVETLPSGLAPMQRIALEGRAYRSIGRGRMPWWIIISSWLVFAIPAVSWASILLSEALPPILTSISQPNAIDWSKLLSAMLVLLLHLAFPTLILYVVSKGTIAKLRTTRHYQ
ncbi:MAG: hypothetical protein KME43_22095 [Myxacorys chilensis ATA2-1-KO14]|jgi:hypothetical protein|nr:hypothetical protein [Myxacorys chilensis ATA2-1-KO14]